MIVTRTVGATRFLRRTFDISSVTLAQEMQREAWSWHTARFPEPARLIRWGHFGTPVLLFPSAGGDFEELERFGLIAALAPLLQGGRAKIYSMDGLAARGWLSGKASARRCRNLQERFDELLCEEVVPRIRADCKEAQIEPVLGGVAWGAFYAISAMCRHPALFRAAVGLSGIYDLTPRLADRAARGPGFVAEAALPRLTAADLEQLRQRPLLLGTGSGAYETPAESERLAAVLRSNELRCQLDVWGPQYAHGWASWREKLPQFIAQSV